MQNLSAAGLAPVSELTFGRLRVTREGVTYAGRSIAPPIADRLINALGKGAQITNVAKFLSQLFSNTREDVIQHAQSIMEASPLLLTPKGRLLAYIKVDGDYFSFPDANFVCLLHPVGEEMLYPECRGENEGFAFYSWQNLPEAEGETGRVMMVDICPSDIVAIEGEGALFTGLTRRYTIVGEIALAHARFAFTGGAEAPPALVAA